MPPDNELKLELAFDYILNKYVLRETVTKKVLFVQDRSLPGTVFVLINGDKT